MINFGFFSPPDYVNSVLPFLPSQQTYWDPKCQRCQRCQINPTSIIGWKLHQVMNSYIRERSYFNGKKKKSKHACPIVCLYSLSQYKECQDHKEWQPESDEIACIIVYHTKQNETETNYFSGFFFILVGSQMRLDQWIWVLLFDWN